MEKNNNNNALATPTGMVRDIFQAQPEDDEQQTLLLTDKEE